MEGYCHNFESNKPYSHKKWIENWVDRFKNSGGKDPHTIAEDVALCGKVLSNWLHIPKLLYV